MFFRVIMQCLLYPSLNSPWIYDNIFFRTLSAIYSQLGNAYFYLGDYVRAMQYHKHDLTLARTMGDRLGEAKASGNLGNTLKVIGEI